MICALLTLAAALYAASTLACIFLTRRRVRGYGPAAVLANAAVALALVTAAERTGRAR